MTDWSKGEYGVYALCGQGVSGMVTPDGELWNGRVICKNILVYHSEWDGREEAMKHTVNAMYRAVWVHRFDVNPPNMPDSEEDEA